MGIRKNIEDSVIEKLGDRFPPYAVRNSLSAVSSRWKIILSPAEKKKIARTLGGNRYAKTTLALLEAVFDQISEDNQC